MATANIEARLKNVEARIDKIEAQHDVILKAVKKKKENAIFGLEDENEERGNWSGRFDFFLSCLGYAVGLGNVWRFPYLCYKNGGGAFFIPYVIMLVFAGMPIFFLELSLGQFTSSGPMTCWKYSPLFQGIGIGMVGTTALQAIYYNIILAWSFYYLFASFTSDLPWEKCEPEWSSKMCIDNIALVEDSTHCFSATGYHPKDDGACYDVNGTVFAIYDQKLAKQYGIERKLPSAQYFDRYVTRSFYSDGLQDLGPMQWKLVLCYLLAFFIVTIALSKSIKSSGKAVYFTATFPYVVLLILFIRGLMLEGHEKGIEFYIKPDLSRLSESVIWKDAAVQIFFSLSASWGGLIALSSYNRFHNDAMRDAVIISISNCLTSVFAGFVIFSYLGNLAHVLGVEIDEVADSGPSLAFVVYPYAVTKLPGAPFWAIIFFLMLITLGLDSIRRFLQDIETMIGKRVCGCLPFYITKYWWAFNWCLATPGLVTFIMIFSWVKYTGMEGNKFPDYADVLWWLMSLIVVVPIYFIMIFSWVKYSGMEGGKFPDYADVLGWLMSLIAVVAILGGALYTLCRAETCKEATQPLKNWGPALERHRALVAEYSPDFVVNPWGGKSDSNKITSPHDVTLQVQHDKTGLQYDNKGYMDTCRM